MKKPVRDHYALHFDSKEDAPYGDMKSWLQFYKLNPDAGETYVAADGFYNVMKKGDVLWFILDKRILAGVPILRVQEDCINKRFELWYNSAELRFCHALLRRVPTHELKPPIIHGESWWERSANKT